MNLATWNSLARPFFSFAALSLLGILAFTPALCANQSFPLTEKQLLLERINEEYPSLEALFKHLHAYPELALQEVKTSARLAQELKKAGFTVTEKIGGHGLVALLKNGPGPTVMVRADMDGLPIVEMTGLKYASKEIGRDQDGKEFGVMHACGHDVKVS